MKTKIIALTLCAATLSACSNIGTVNGVPVGKNARISTKDNPTYCAENPAVCIIGGVVAVGALGYLINEANDEGDSGSGDTDDDVEV